MAAVEVFQRILTDDRWMNDAACRGLTHLFFPARPSAHRRERREAAARTVCLSCSVNGSCRSSPGRTTAWLWGGESEDERHAAGFRLIAPIGVRARNAG
jgi:WhiB family redox-sensing transcriptional regulator